MEPGQQDNALDAAALVARYQQVRADVDAAALACGRDPMRVGLVAVSKTHPPEAIWALYDAGARDFGENYVQELLAKRALLPQDIRWHFIGRLQSNKARQLVDGTWLVHSVDRPELLEALSARATRPVRCLLQVKLGPEETKGGAGAESLEALLARALELDGVVPCGLMGMPPYEEDPEAARPWFAQAQGAFQACRRYLGARAPERLDDFSELSMGMSHDFAVAIEQGATLVRVGTAIFGERTVRWEPPTAART